MTVFGSDPRVYCTTIKRFVGDENGHVKEAHTVQIEWAHENGKYVPKEIPARRRSSPRSWSCWPWAFWGQRTRPLSSSVSSATRAATPRPSSRSTRPASRACSPRDARRGQSLIVWAISEGRGAARECDRFLMGVTNLP